MNKIVIQKLIRDNDEKHHTQRNLLWCLCPIDKAKVSVGYAVIRKCLSFGFQICKVWKKSPVDPWT